MSHGGRLAGEIRVPGDKSVSHRALIIGALAEGETSVEGLSSGGDVASTRRCLEAFGVEITGDAPSVRVKGRGLGGLRLPEGDLDAGNSGTTMRLLAGVAAGHQFRTRFTGDASLSRRPMRRVAEPLGLMGAGVELSPEGTPPLTVFGKPLKGIEYAMPVASAQVKSCVLLAGLHASGDTTVIEPAATRDHTERMLAAFGVPVRASGARVAVSGGARPRATKVVVPGDPSSAAFWVVAATLAEESELAIRGVASNPTRTGYLSVLARMGADVHREPMRGVGGEPLEDLIVSHSGLHGAAIDASEVPGLVDEIPILALAAALARGVSRFSGLSELRHKESDRLTGVADLLNAFGGKARVEGDDLVIEGVERLLPGRADALDDHRLAMTAYVAAFLAGGESEVSGLESASISYPSFYEDFHARVVS